MRYPRRQQRLSSENGTNYEGRKLHRYRVLIIMFHQHLPNPGSYVLVDYYEERNRKRRETYSSIVIHIYENLKTKLMSRELHSKSNNGRIKIFVVLYTIFKLVNLFYGVYFQDYTKSLFDLSYNWLEINVVI